LKRECHDCQRGAGIPIELLSVWSWPWISN
jgi:hypothetical protein